MNKLDRLRDQLREKNVDAMLVTNPYNRRYITGFTGTAGVALITEKAAIFITDFRYMTQAKSQAKAFTIVEHKKTIEAEIANQLKHHQIKRLAFEEENVTYAKYTEYEQAFSVELVATNRLIEALRIVKTADEIDILKHAASIADAAFDHIISFIQAGKTEIEVANELEFFMRKKGATSSSFDMIVASGERSALPHGVASNKVIQSGELVTLDFGALYEGYCSDITRTVAVGQINDELKNIYEIVLEAQKRGVAGVKPGMTGEEADHLTRDYITEQGYGEYFGHSTGHGIGLEIHEGPRLAPRNEGILETNMVVTVEPGIYVPEVGGCRIEDDIVLTASGNERLTLAPKELIHI